MNKILKVLALLIALATAAHADEIFVATAGTGTQNVGSNIDVNAAAPPGYPGDPGATFVYGSIASNWNLVWANWGNGNGYATMDVDTNHSTGWYNVGNVNSTWQTIWVILQ